MKFAQDSPHFCEVKLAQSGVDLKSYFSGCRFFLRVYLLGAQSWIMGPSSLQVSILYLQYKWSYNELKKNVNLKNEFSNGHFWHMFTGEFFAQKLPGEKSWNLYHKLPIDGPILCEFADSFLPLLMPKWRLRKFRPTEQVRSFDPTRRYI